MSKRKKKDWIELIDEKLNDLERKIENLEKHVKQTNELLAEDMLIFTNLAFDFTNISLQRKTDDLGHFDHYFKRIKSRVKISEELTKIRAVTHDDLMALIIRLLRSNGVPFEKVAPYLIEKLGRKLAKELVKKETMLEHYGEEGLRIWETLLGE